MIECNDRAMHNTVWEEDSSSTQLQGTEVREASSNKSLWIEFCKVRVLAGGKQKERVFCIGSTVHTNAGRREGTLQCEIHWLQLQLRA